MKNDKGLLITVAAFGTATLLVILFTSNSSNREAQLASLNDRDSEVSFERSKRSDDASLFEDYVDEEEACDSWFAEGDDCYAEADAEIDATESFNDLENDVMIFQRRGKNNKNKKSKNNGGNSVNNAPLIDSAELLNSPEGQQQISSLQETLVKKVSNIHKKVDVIELAHNSPEVIEFPMYAQYAGAVAHNTWDALKANNGQDCSFGAANRITEDTSSVFMLYPSDMMYETQIDQQELYKDYKNFYTNLASKMHKETKIVVSSYSGSNIRVSKHHKTPDIGLEMDRLTPDGLNAPIRNGQIKIAQARLNSVLNKLSATTRSRYARNDMTGEKGETCFAIIIIHTLPTDYKDFALGSESDLDFSEFRSRCKLIPISIVPNGFISNFNGLMGSIIPEATTHTTIENGLRGVYSHGAQAGLDMFFTHLADKLTSYMCSVENRVLCMFSRKAWYEQLVDLDRSVDYDDETTTTEWTTSTSTTSTTTTETTTTSTEAYETEPIEDIFACCGSGSDAKTYNLNKQECCGNKAVGFSLIDLDGFDVCEY